MHWEKIKNSQNGQNQRQENQNNRPPDASRLRGPVAFILWGTGSFLLVLLVASGWMWSYAHTPAPAVTDTVVVIPKGSGVRRIQSILVESGVMNDDIRFLLLARITGTAGRLRAGEYLFPAGQPPLQTLRQMEQGKVLLHRVTIPEGMTNRQIAEILAAGKWIDPSRFLALTGDPDFIKTLGINVASLEGYLFPDTYTLARGSVTEKSIIAMMTGRFLDIWNSIAAGLPSSLERHQVITLASIVEKETGMADERPLVAGVFRNRLARNMRLQSDPTVIYGLVAFDGDLTRADLEKRTPYNTYVVRGLPPGPICNPGRDSILAVLHPADVPYLYFVAKNDGSHHFSTNLPDHNRAVRKYQIPRRNIHPGPAANDGQ